MFNNLYIKYACITALLTIVSGCAIVLPLSVATTGMIASDERSFGVMIDDKMILARIKSEISKYSNAYIFLSVHVNVLEGRVLLTGSIISKEHADEIVKKIWLIKGVKEVLDELKVELKSMENSASDTVISNAISSKFLIERNFSSSNYDVAVNDGNVFLLGIARNQEEMDKALTIARNVTGVKKVVNYIILREDPRRMSNK